MTFQHDPYAVLGLPEGASPDEVKRAYRRLAKAFHPDTAGPTAMPRFLAIQSAYERLTGQKPGAVPGAGGRASPGQEAGTRRTGSWRADPDRARGSRDGWRTRSRRSGGTSGTASRGEAADGPAGRGEAADGRAGHGRAERGPGERGQGERGRGATGEPAGRERGSDRPRRRATPGSTSYDEAEHEPFDPDWSGASWYGQSSGTYWTINPREYADPRKHGPEYEARARRTAGAGDEDEAAHHTSARGRGAPTTDEPVFRPRARRGDSRPRAGATTSSTPGDAMWGGPGDRPTQRAADAGPGARAGSPDPPGSPPAVGLGSPLPAVFGGPWARLALALVGWPPLGLGLAWLAGELSGCGRFSAACTAGLETFAIGTWLLQLVVIGVLVIVPGAAAVSAVGSVGMLAAAVPAAVLLSISGGARQPEAAATALVVFLAVGYVVGVLFAIARRSRTIPG